MEKYKAKQNNNDNINGIPEKTEEEKKQESTEKAVDLAGEVLLDVFTEGQGSTVKNLLGNVPVVGDVVNNVWDGAVREVSNVVSKTPAGDLAKQADDAGVTDTLKSAKKLINFGSGGGADGAAMAADGGGMAANAGGMAANGGGMAANAGGMAANGGGMAANGGGMNANSHPNLSNPTTPPDSKKAQSYGSSQQGGKKQSNSDSVFSSNSSSLTDNIMKLPIMNSTKIGIIGVVSLIFLSAIIVTITGKDLATLAMTNEDEFANTMSSPNRKYTQNEIEEKLVYFGDRNVSNINSAVSNESIKHITNSNANYEWLINTGMQELDNLLSENPDKIVILSFGYNDLNNIDNYINVYNEIISKYPNTKFFILSLNPIDETLASNNGITITNQDIENFNNKMKENFPNIYLDTYSGLNYTTTDGINYDTMTYSNIHNDIVKQLMDSTLLVKSSGGDLLAKLEEVGKYYIESVRTYWAAGNNSRAYYQTPFGTRKFGDDCTEFVAAYMSYVSGVDIPESYSLGMIDPNGLWAQTVANHGWKVYTSDEVDTLQPGDVLIADNRYSYSTKGQHGEVYINENETFGWGSVKSVYPTQNPITKTSSNGHVHFMDRTHDYITIYRYGG